MSNFILAHRSCNSAKGQMTAFDFMEGKGGDAHAAYIDRVNALYDNGKGSITKSKLENLLCPGSEIPTDFVERMKKDSQYIAKETVKLMKTICHETHTSTGQITDFLREKWELKHVLEELMLPVYEAIGQVATKEIKTHGGGTKTITKPVDWTKRDDHRHHAVDALIVALTNPKIIHKLNNLNKIYQLNRDALTDEELKNLQTTFEDNYGIKSFAELRDIDFAHPCPICASRRRRGWSGSSCRSRSRMARC